MVFAPWQSHSATEEELCDSGAGRRWCSRTLSFYRVKNECLVGAPQAEGGIALWAWKFRWFATCIKHGPRFNQREHGGRTRSAFNVCNVFGDNEWGVCRDDRWSLQTSRSSVGPADRLGKILGCYRGILVFRGCNQAHLKYKHDSGQIIVASGLEESADGRQSGFSSEFNSGR